MKFMLNSAGQFCHRVVTRTGCGFTMEQFKHSVKPLPEPEAVEKGMLMMSEGLVYALMFGVGLYEVKKVMEEARMRERRRLEYLERVQGETDFAEQESQQLLQLLTSMKTQVQTPTSSPRP